MIFFFSLVFFISSQALSTNSYIVANNVNQQITEFSTCKSITNSSGSSIMIPTKTSAEWSSFYSNNPVNTTVSTCPEVSCNAILNNGGSTGDGVYTIDPDGSGGNAPFNVYCDMTTDGGGWTLVANIVQDDVSNGDWNYNSAWWNNDTSNTVESNFLTGNKKTKAYSAVTGTQMILKKNNTTKSITITLGNTTAGTFFNTSGTCSATQHVTPQYYIPNGCWTYSQERCEVYNSEVNSYGGSGYYRLRLHKSGGCGSYWNTSRAFGTIHSSGPTNSKNVYDWAISTNDYYSIYIK